MTDIADSDTKNLRPIPISRFQTTKNRFDFCRNQIGKTKISTI